MRKIIALGIMLLFVGMSVVSSTGDIVENEHSYHRSLKSVDNSEEILSWGKIAFGLSIDIGWEYRICYIELNDPQNITWLGSGLLPAFFTGGTWTNDGRWIVCEYYTGALWEIDPINGDMEHIGGGGSGLNSLTYDPVNEKLYGASGSNLWKIDIETGEQEFVGSFGVTTLMTGIAFDAEGTLYAWSISPDTLYTVDIDTGECTEVGPLGINHYGGEGAFEFEDDILYLAAYAADDPALYKCDEDTGNCTLVGPLGADLYAFAIPYENDGNTLYVGGSGPDNYTRIQDAIDNASDGDTVFVYNGTYDSDGSLIIDKSINLIGENKHNTIINGSGIEVTSEVYVSSFTIQNGAMLILSDNSTISGNIFKSAIGFGGILTSAYNTISHNTFLNCGLFTDGSHNSVYNNTVNGKPLVYLEDESDMVVDDAGQVILVDCENINIENLELTNTIIGIQLFYSTDCLISGNKISGNYIVGISLIKSNNITISGNVISEIGVLFLDSKHNTISGNNFDNGFDITFSTVNLIFENSSGNYISNNNFRYSQLYKGIFSIDSDNKWNGNYWNRPRILPVLIWGFKTTRFPLRYYLDFDWHPAEEPYDIEV